MNESYIFNHSQLLYYCRYRLQRFIFRNFYGASIKGSCIYSVECCSGAIRKELHGLILRQMKTNHFHIILHRHLRSDSPPWNFAGPINGAAVISLMCNTFHCWNCQLSNYSYSSSCLFLCPIHNQRFWQGKFAIQTLYGICSILFQWKIQF